MLSGTHLLIAGAASDGDYDTHTLSFKLGGQQTTTSTYSTQWQVLNETNQNGTAEGGANYVCSQLPIADPAPRDTLSSTGTLTTRAYPRQNDLPADPGGCSNWNVTSLVTYTGGTWTTAERFESTPYGVVTVLNSNFTTKTGGTGFAWKHLHQGLEYDASTGLYIARFRWYHPGQGRWLQVDPLTYIEGSNFYCYVSGSPLNWNDALGLAGDSVSHSLTAAILAGDVAAIRTLLAIGGNVLPAAARQLAQQYLKRVAECELIHSQYHNLNCKACRPCMTQAELAPRVRCRALEVALRTAYLKKKCDYVLPGSIRAGSKVKERSHWGELAFKTAALAHCYARWKELAEVGK